MLKICDIKNYVANQLTPKNPLVKGAAYGTAWYAGAIIHTYSQPVFIELFKQATIGLLGVNAGTGIGLCVVSPALVPAIVPSIAIAGAAAAYYGTTAIGNIAHQAIFGSPKASGDDDKAEINELGRENPNLLGEIPKEEIPASS